eukprot:3416793-Prymnesium_polylepis.2
MLPGVLMVPVRMLLTAEVAPPTVAPIRTVAPAIDPKTAPPTMPPILLDATPTATPATGIPTTAAAPTPVPATRLFVPLMTPETIDCGSGALPIAEGSPLAAGAMRLANGSDMQVIGERVASATADSWSCCASIRAHTAGNIAQDRNNEKEGRSTAHVTVWSRHSVTIFAVADCWFFHRLP